jgi:indolepyruvate ferredoxin oxidoreductase
MSVDLVDPAVRLSATEGRTHLTGLQALARVPIEVRRRDHATGRSTAAFISGYEGSPLAGYDLVLMHNALRHGNLAGAHHGVVPMSVRMTQ